MSFSFARTLAGVDSLAELGLVLRTGRHMRVWIDTNRPATGTEPRHADDAIFIPPSCG